MRNSASRTLALPGLTRDAGHAIPSASTLQPSRGSLHGVTFASSARAAAISALKAGVCMILAAMARPSTPSPVLLWSPGRLSREGMARTIHQQ